MKSKWFDKKDVALKLRQQGVSIRTIEMRLGVPRSTLSGWCKNIVLTDTQNKKLKQQHETSLQRARSKAVVWHRAQKEQRLYQAQYSAQETMRKLDLSDTSLQKALLAALYMGEGAKKDGTLVLGSSDPTILTCYLSILRSAYNVDIDTLRIELHLRADQDGDTLMQYWLKTLHLPQSARGSIYKDARTAGKPTYEGYNGVCIIGGGGSRVQRELLYLGRSLFSSIGKNMRV